jgi:hypothetical protein
MTIKGVLFMRGLQSAIRNACLRYSAGVVAYREESVGPPAGYVTVMTTEVLVELGTQRLACCHGQRTFFIKQR